MPPTNYEKALDQALKAAYVALKTRDLKDRAFKSGASYEGSGNLTLAYLNGTATVDTGSETLEINTRPAGTREAILILHYLLEASGKPLTGQMISFKEAPQGSLYFQPFRNRVLLPMAGLLANNRTGFEESAKRLGGEPLETGDLSCRFQVFPYVTVQYVWYQGEEEMPPDLNLLFDASTPDYLSTEDMVVMCEELNRQLKSLLPQQREQNTKPGRTNSR